MGKRIVGSLLGLGMMALSVGAYLSDEPASKTDKGLLIIAVFFVFGFIAFLNGMIGKKATPSVPQTPSQVMTPTILLCPACQKPVSPEFTVCPYCATVLKPKCPNCQKEVSSDFKNCPYCGSSLLKP
jgi:RNA polymerase subunit RPABC4/transcription elongation factor Spt4